MQKRENTLNGLPNNPNQLGKRTRQVELQRLRSRLKEIEELRTLRYEVPKELWGLTAFFDRHEKTMIHVVEALKIIANMWEDHGLR